MWLLVASVNTPGSVPAARGYLSLFAERWGLAGFLPFFPIAVEQAGLCGVWLKGASPEVGQWHGHDPGWPVTLALLPGGPGVHERISQAPGARACPARGLELFRGFSGAVSRD